MLVQHAHKFCIYSTAGQRKRLAVEFGNDRFVWNRRPNVRGKAWEADKTRHNYVSLNRMVTGWKHGEFPWLADSTASCLTKALIDQDKAYKNFFEKRDQYPKLKSRRDRQAVRYQLDQRQIERIYGAGERLKFPKLGAVKVRWSRTPAGLPKMATVSKDPTGRYFAAFSCEETIEALLVTGQTVGVDLGVHDVAVTSDGWKSGNPRHLKRRLRHLKHQQQRLSRMKKGSHRRDRQRRKVARIHAKIADARADFLHKTTTAIVHRADTIAIEDLNVRGMVKNCHLVSAITDVSMGEFHRQIEYKASWYGWEVLFADRWAPTSKACSACGSVRDKLPLHVREWTCPD